MKIKEIDRTANLAWSPKPQYPILLAAGTSAQQLDASFNTSAALELYTVNLADPSLDLELCHSVPSQFRFHKLCWGAYGHGGDSDKGLIAGGCDAGRLLIYSAGRLMKKDNELVASQERRSGPIRALDFNHFQSNLLATGSSESEILIWDMYNLSTPMTPGAPSQPFDDIISLSWNKQVQHILATAFSTRCVVWDLRKNESIIKLTDPTAKIRWKIVNWNPEVATQLCLASEEDQYPVIQMWDLRFATSPIKIFEGHQKGVLSAAWCDEDSDLFVSCGKDNKLLVWNPNTSSTNGEIVCDMTINTQWNFEVNWCPRNPFLIASSSFDGRTSVFSLTGGQSIAPTSNKIADSFPGMNQYSHSVPPQQVPHQQYSVVELLKPPKWMKKPSGVKFAFGGKLISFGSSENFIYISQVITEPNLKNEEFEEALEQGGNGLTSYCLKKAEQCNNSDIKEIWNLLGCQFYGDVFREKVFSLLGTNSAVLEEQLSSLNLDDVGGNSDPFTNASHIGPAGDDIFENISNQNDNNLMNSLGSQPKRRSFLKLSPKNDLEDAICNALLLGNIEVAIDLCIEDGKMADAIVLSMTGGPELIAKTQAKYFEKSDSYLTKFISSIVNEDWYNVIKTCDLSQWKQILVALLTYTRDKELYSLCELFGQRIQTEGDESLKNSALICYIVSGNVNRLLENIDLQDLSTAYRIQQLAELGLISREGLKYRNIDQPASGSFTTVLVQYAELLVSQGFLVEAYTYLGEIDEESVQLLKDRLAYLLGLKTNYQTYPAKQDNSAVKPSNYFQLQPQQQPPQPVPGYRSNPVPNQFKNSPKSVVKPYNTAATSAPIPPSSLPPVPPTNHVPPVSFPQTTFAPGVPSIPPFNPQPQYVAQPKTSVTQMPPGPPTIAPRPPSIPNQQTIPGPQPSYNRSTPTPPPPPPMASNMPYNNPRKTPEPVTQARSKYVVDPSVQGGAPRISSNAFSSNSFQNSTSMMTQSNFSSVQPFMPNESAVYQMNQASSVGSSIYVPGGPDMSTNYHQPPPPPAQEAPKVVPLTPSAPGWNDPPPSMSFGKPPAQNQIGYVTPNPITHPLYSSVPEPAPPANLPPPPTASSTNLHNSSQMNGAISRPPLPEQHMHLETVLEELRSRCYMKTNNQQMKRKLEDVARKLEMMYDSIRNSKISQQTLTGLHEIVNALQHGNYQACLQIHTQLVSGPEFSSIASFMPGIKVLVQSALQLDVYL